MSGIEQIRGMMAGVSSVASGSPATASGAPFADLFKGLAAQTGKLDAAAQRAVSGLLTGQGVEVHDAMIATQKADMAFELALQVRNKAVGAYQQMMAMQF